MRTLLLIGILAFTCSCGTRKNIKSNSEIPQEFFQRWKLDYGIAHNQKISGLPQSPINDYEFKQNGEYIIYKQGETFITGTWEYHKEEKVIYTKRSDGELNGKITNIKPQSILLIPAGRDIEGTPFEKFQFYYIPKIE